MPWRNTGSPLKRLPMGAGTGMLTGMSATGVMSFQGRNTTFPFQCVLSSGIEGNGSEIKMGDRRSKSQGERWAPF